MAVACNMLQPLSSWLSEMDQSTLVKAFKLLGPSTWQYLQALVGPPQMIPLFCACQHNSFLLLLRNNQMISGQTHYTCHMLDKIMCSRDLRHVVPTYWCPGMLTIIYDKRSIPQWLLPRVIICKFNHCKKFIPIILHWVGIMPQHIF